MRLATWNVNSLSVRQDQVLAWLAQNPVEVLGLQELKLTEEQFPYDAFARAGYQAVVLGQKTYNGVALLSRTSLGHSRDITCNLPQLADPQARVIAATLDHPALGSLRIVNAYVVNGQAPETEKFAYKMQWLDALRAYLCEQLSRYPKLVVMGDFNITLDDRDTHDPEGLYETIHHTEAERSQLRALLDLGLHDAFRLFEQPARSYSWWDYRNLAFRRKRGLRIDYVLVSDALKPWVSACMIDVAPRKNERPSDHAPVIVTLGQLGMTADLAHAASSANPPLHDEAGF